MPHWPVEARCRLLRSGARRFLDSSDPAYSSRLVESAATLAHDYRTQQRAGDELRSVMQALGLVGQSPAFLALLRTVVRVAPLSDIPVLITGETGTGKELFARAIHQRDPARAKRAMVAVNCSALAPGLLESELFGYRRGAFTGADHDRAGLLRSADEGVLFLDEVGDLPLELQAKFLRTIQFGEFTPIGSDRASQVDVRIVAATNQPIEALVAQGKFREDLYHRLNVVRLRIPPLRERKEDIAPLAHHFFARYNRDGVKGLEPDLVGPGEQKRALSARSCRLSAGGLGRAGRSRTPCASRHPKRRFRRFLGGGAAGPPSRESGRGSPRMRACHGRNSPEQKAGKPKRDRP
jgi:transcriptional regulator with PAS, ATPase and Fis domain